MIVGLFLKHYKIYNGIKFIPITKDDFFTAYIGPNGSGKSSILESLDSFFNSREWNINKQARSGGGIVYINTPYIAPVFLVRKNSLSDTSSSDKNSKATLSKLSDYFWNVERKQISSSTSEITDFIAYREQLKDRYDSNDYFLFIIGKRYEQPNKNYFGSFHHQKSFLSVLGYNDNKTDKNREEAYPLEDEYIQIATKSIFEYISMHYTYIYIPSEIDVGSFTKLETIDMQTIMNRNIHNEIQKAIKAKNLYYINKSLNTFVDEITKKLNIYAYKKPTGGKANITMNDLIAKIIESFFSIRVLSKHVGSTYIPVNDLSSGEKRKALIDLAYAFLNSSNNHDKNIIIGIDEPEISLHVSACFDQFEKVKNISKFHHQVLITTHWYGFLPIVSDGIAHSTNLSEDEKVVFESFELKNYREIITIQKRKNKGKLPYDIYLKSFNDLIQSIISSIRCNNNYKWILCEGSSEQIYFSHYLHEEIDKSKFRILPLGGCGEVVRLYKYLEVSMEDRELDTSGKVIAIVDTDEEHINFVPKNGIKNLFFKRLLFKNEQIELINVESNIVSPVTEIEDVLNPKYYIETLRNLGDDSIQKLLVEENINQTATVSYNCLDLKQSDRTLIKDFFEKEGNKTLFARNYVKLSSDNNDTLPLIEKIKELLNE